MAQHRFMAFYWTLPVPTHSFLNLPKGIEAAAQASRTIRHQREIAQAWVREEGGLLAPEDEVAYLESDPDHGTERMVPEVEKLLGRCKAEGKTLLVVALWQMEESGWRRHHRLIERLEAEERKAAKEDREPLCIQLPPDRIRDHKAIKAMLDNFEHWRKVRREFTEGKPAQEALLRQVIEEMKGEGGARASSEALAEALNAAGHRTPSRRRWTGANLRQFLRRQRLAEAEAKRAARRGRSEGGDG